MIERYTHEDLHNEVRSISGYYMLEEEKRLDYNGRDVLYIVGFGAVDNSCCGIGGCRFALIPGFLVAWKTRTDENGRSVSEVETIEDEKARGEISRMIKENETVGQVEFW